MGVWVAGWISQWVGMHWQSARPAVVFGVLRWLVAGLGGLAVASLFQWGGELLAGAVHNTPVGAFDRLGGFGVGTLLGAVFAAVLLLVLILGPWPRTVRATAAQARVTPPLMAGSAQACAYCDRYFPGGDWLRRRFLAAQRLSAGAARHS